MATLKRYPFDPEDKATFLAVRERLRAEQRLGGSEIGTAAGQNKYKSRRRLWLEMTGQMAAADSSERQPVKDGTRLEAVAAVAFMEKTGKRVHKVNAVLVNPEVPHLFASPDRKVENEDAYLEIKTASAFNYEAFMDGRLPDWYAKQVKCYMKVTGVRRYYVVVWIPLVCERYYIFTEDAIAEGDVPEWCDRVVEVSDVELDECEDIAAEWFEKYVAAGVAPGIDGTEDEAAAIKAQFPKPSEGAGARTITGTSVTDLERMEFLKGSIKDFEGEIAAIENRIKAEMGEAAEGWIGERRVTWKCNKDSLKVDYKGVVEELNPSPEVIDRHTAIRPGARVLRIGKAK